MTPTLKEKSWHNLFELGLALKAFNGIWETATGIFMLVVSKATLHKWFMVLAYSELIEDPHDGVVNFIVNTLLNPLTNTKTFVTLYVLFHGLLNIFLTVQLYRKKHWAYPTTIGLMSVFQLYQFYRIGVHHSFILTFLTVFDVIFMVLTWHEYRHHINQKLAHPEPAVSSSLPK